MALFKIGEKDRDGRQKRIEHSGRYLRASRTGGVSLRAQTRAAGINLTGNTRHGVRVSTRLARNTQVALQNGRFVLRGRYGSDAARLNLSKSGVTVSSKTPIGSFNWVRPGRSSVKFGGIHMRGHKAAGIQGIFALVFGVVWLLGAVLALITRLLNGLVRLIGAVCRRRRIAEEEAARPYFDLATVRRQGEAVLGTHSADPAAWPARDRLAAIAFALLVLGRGTAGAPRPPARDGIPDAATAALLEDLAHAGEHWQVWLGTLPPDDLQPAAGILALLAESLARDEPPEWAAETLLALDDASLRDGPKTLLQEALIDLTAEAMGVELLLEGER
ncbi:hypothetical protein [Thioalkalivibrio sp. ALJ24]|uniref:hypothetical protein n=1 Tax=Thioalkalivibrio sp. ALJ24 TaxID=545276 RepID=UPI0003785A9E|nr:hypothetical protein [Thioalkalivibrio sp. ALJ24]